jgi:hypothetical protein
VILSEAIGGIGMYCLAEAGEALACLLRPTSLVRGRHHETVLKEQWNAENWRIVVRLSVRLCSERRQYTRALRGRAKWRDSHASWLSLTSDLDA